MTKTQSKPSKHGEMTKIHQDTWFWWLSIQHVSLSMKFGTAPKFCEALVIVLKQIASGPRLEFFVAKDQIGTLFWTCYFMYNIETQIGQFFLWQIYGKHFMFLVFLEQLAKHLGKTRWSRPKPGEPAMEGGLKWTKRSFEQRLVVC